MKKFIYTLGVVVSCLAVTTGWAQTALKAKLVQTLKGHTGPVNSARYSPDGKFVVTASDDKTAKIWEAATGKLVLDLKDHLSPVTYARFNADGKYVTTDGAERKVWQVATGKFVRNATREDLPEVTSKYSPDERYSIEKRRDEVEIWETPTKKIFCTITPAVRAPNRPTITMAEFSPDGRYVVTASPTNIAQIWEIPGSDKPEPQVAFKATDPYSDRTISSATFNSDGKLIVIASANNTAQVWEIASGQLLVTLTGHTYRVESASFSASGKYIVTTAADNTAKIWDAANGTLLWTLKHAAPINSASFSTNEKYIVTASDDRSVKIWEVVTGIVFKNLSGHTGAVHSASFSPDDKYIVTASADKTAKVWDPARGNFIDLTGHTNSVNSAAFSPDSKYVVTASADKTAKVWEASTGKQLLDLAGEVGHIHNIREASFSNDGKYIATASWDKTSKIWDAKTGEMLWVLDAGGNFSSGIGATGPTSKAAFSADGRYLVTSGEVAKVWETETGKLLWSIPGRNNWNTEAIFSPDGKYILDATAQNGVKIWQMPGAFVQAAPKPTAPANLEIRSISFSDKDGNQNSILDANEKAAIGFTVSNTGKGNAYNLVAQIKQLNTVNGIKYSAATQLGNLNAGANTTISIPVSADLNVESGTCELEITIKEGNSFDSEPVLISLSTQKFKNPVVAIADHKFATEGNRVRLNLPISLEIILQNRGQGEASNIKVSFKNPQNVFKGGESDFIVDKLRPNESKNIVYDFFANKSYTAKEIPIEVTVTENYGKYGDKQTFKVSLEENLALTQVVKIEGQSGKDVPIDNVSLRPVIEAEAPASDDSIEKSVKASGPAVFYSLFIGVEKYQFSSATLPNLNKPVSDATMLRNMLLNDYNFTEDKSIFLKNPTRAEIINTLEALGRKITPKDNLLIFYAGHGYWDPRFKLGYWLPSDSKPLDDNDKSNWLSNSVIKDYIFGIQSKHTLLITDACFGGSIFKTREVTSEMGQFAASQLYRLPSRKAMTSGTLTTVPDESKFMEFLLKRLADNTSDFLTAQQLFISIVAAVMNNTTTVPQLGVIQDTGDEGGDFLFMRKK